MKKVAFITIGAVLLALTLFLVMTAVKKENEMIIQGEVDTKTIDLSSKITGRVKTIKVKKGDVVKKGDILVILDTPDIQAKASQADATLDLTFAQEQMSLNSLKQAQAGAELARKTYERVNNLYKEGVVPAQKRDEARAQYLSSMQTVNVARAGYQQGSTANVRKARGAISEVSSYLKENRIVAPSTGEITDITIEEGELVGAGYPIVTMVDNSDNWIVLNLREDLLSKIRMGSEFDVKIPALTQKPIRVKVNYISVMGNFATWRATKIRGDFDLKTFEVRAVPVSPVEGMRAGMTVVVNWNKVK